MSRIWGKVKSYVASAISGLYTKPSGGIPKSDLSSDVQTSLGKADSAIQSHQDISGKQDVISDLATIRSGASAGATALQPNDLADWAKSPTRPVYTANDTGALPNTTTLADLEDATHKTVTPTEKETWNGKQDAINDLADIRSGAALGATALQEHQDISDKQDVLESGTNIKTVDGVSILGSGNISTNNDTAYNIRGIEASRVVKETLHRSAICFTYSETEILPSSRTANRYQTDKELTTLDFNPFGRIYAYSQSTDYSEGTAVNAAYFYYQNRLDLRYAFNTGDTLTLYKSVYVKCEPLVDGNNNRTGRVRLATGQPIVQDLPTTADGFVYIFLGIATSTRSMLVTIDHPVYEYRNGGIKLWIGD